MGAAFWKPVFSGPAHAGQAVDGTASESPLFSTGRGGGGGLTRVGDSSPPSRARVAGRRIAAELSQLRNTHTSLPILLFQPLLIHKLYP